MSDSPTFEEQVNDAVNNMTQNDDGKWQLPEGLDEATTFAANAERRRRDTQAALHQEQNRSKALSAQNEKLAEGWEKDVASTLTPAQNAELDELKATDPDAWREKINAYEVENRTKFKETKEGIVKEANEGTELEQREAAMAAFNEANPDIQLTDEVIENDLPPRLLKQLEAGEVTFEGFLANVKTYLTSGKVVKTGEEPPNIENLGDAGGSSTPSQEAIEAEAKASYDQEFY